MDQLSKKLSEANGELVRASDVMDMISKREIPFEMVAGIFEDMTSKGGIFYNMQEKQGNTLYGLWQKLGDAAAVMYSEIGNTDAADTGMRMLIDTMRYAMLHWRQAGTVLGLAGAALLGYTLQTRANALAVRMQTVEYKAHLASLRAKVAATQSASVAAREAGVVTQMNTWLERQHAIASLQAATATNAFARAMYGLKAAFLSNPWGWVALAISTIISLFAQAESELDKLSNKLSEINGRFDTNTTEMKKGFVELANAARDAADGTKTQKDALDEP